MPGNNIYALCFVSCSVTHVYMYTCSNLNFQNSQALKIVGSPDSVFSCSFISMRPSSVLDHFCF